MSLKDYALKLKERLRLNPSEYTVQQIKLELNNKTYSDGTKFSKKDIEYILDIIQYERDKQGHIILKDSDNSVFLKAVSLLKSDLNDKDGK